MSSVFPVQTTASCCTVNADGTIVITKPPAPGNALRNDSKKPIDKNEAWSFVPCTVSGNLRLYRCFVCDDKDSASNKIHDLNTSPHFPFPKNVASTIGSNALIQNNGPFEGQIRGIGAGSTLGVSCSTDIAHALMQATSMEPKDVAEKLVVIGVISPFIHADSAQSFCFGKSRCRDFLATEDLTDERHVLIRPILRVTVEDLLPALKALTTGAAIQMDGLWRIKMSTVPDPGKPGKTMNVYHCEKLL